MNEHSIIYRHQVPLVQELCASLCICMILGWKHTLFQPYIVSDKIHLFGQIIATSHDLGPQKVAFWKGSPRLFQGNLGW